MQAMGFQVQSIKSGMTTSKALYDVTMAMTRVNKVYRIETLGKVITEFQSQINLMNLKSEVIEDTSMFSQ